VDSFIKKLAAIKELRQWGVFLNKFSLRVVNCCLWTVDDSPMWMKEKSTRQPTVITPQMELPRNWIIQFRDKYHNEWILLFEVKKSTLDGAGYGLFASRPYTSGDVLGVFYGLISKKIANGKYSSYALEVAWPPESKKASRLIVDPATFGPTSRTAWQQPAYLGIHMVNDPEWHGRKGSPTRTTRASPRSNFMVDMSLVAIATRDIAVGEELFLDYKGDAL
jgi:hypothetical protein